MPLFKIFLDASVILSGLASVSGGSRKLFDVAKKHKFKLMATPLVIEEVARHLPKLNVEVEQLRSILSEKVIYIICDPDEKTIRQFGRICRDENDAHVLAGATLSGASVLISLDKEHILTPKIRSFLKPILVKSPKEFWRWIRGRYMHES